MELKDYQLKVIENLEVFLAELKAQFDEKLEYFEFQQSRGKEAINPEKSDYCQLAWGATQGRISVYSRSYKPRFDGLNRNIPHACFKVPTGGGKTLLASKAVQYINQDFFSRSNGLVLWVMPSQTIYKQTSKQLRNREHPYRQMLDKASGGKTIILEKEDKFTRQDVEGNLCVMLLMLQSGNRDNKDTLRMFRDSGKFPSFFPEVDDYTANNALLNAVPNLETADLGDDDNNVIQGISIKHSLGNVMRQLRPIVIIDEGHRAMSQRALDTINGFNPRFILELSATPKDDVSNILSNVGGAALKKEQMIKLPVNVYSYEEPNWKQTLNNAHAKLLELSQSAAMVQQEEGKYIRPILVIKAEPKKAGDNYDQVADIKKYLIENLNVREEQIRIKLSEKDEIGDEDLLDNLCPVKYIITKDALKEGWDCSFAYVLAILPNTKGKTALTQFIGRVLRQPYAAATKREELNQCYVYCNNAEVNEAVDGIRKGLQDEGMEDVADQINVAGVAASDVESVKLTRNPKFKDTKIFLPQLNSIIKGKVRVFDYYKDILAEINWADYSFNKPEILILADRDTRDFRQVKVDLKIEGNQFAIDFDSGHKQSEQVTASIDLTLMTSQLMDKIPNPWQAIRIINEVLDALNAKHKPDKIALNAVYIVEEIKRDCFKWLIEKSEAIFKDKLDSGNIMLKLLAEPFLKLNWRMADEVSCNRKTNEPAVNLERNIFQPQYMSNYNGLERNVALAINKQEAVLWWHRLAVRGSEYSVQGWRKDKIYPDFLVKLQEDENGDSQLYFVETKGQHLEGNDDTSYKQKVFECLNKHLASNNDSKGELKLISGKEKHSFNMIFEDEWETGIRNIFAGN